MKLKCTILKSPLMLMQAIGLLISILPLGAQSQNRVWADNFNSYNNGVLASDATGVTAGQGGWYIFNSSTAAGSGANDYTIVADPVDANNKVVKVIAGTTATGNNVTRFAWTDSLHNFMANSPAAYDSVVVKYRFYMGGASSTSTNRYGLYIYDATGTKVLAGVTAQNSTGQFYLVGSYNNAGTIGNYSFSTGLGGATSPPVLARNTWYDFVVIYIKTTGRFVGGFSTNGGSTWSTFFVDGAAAGTVPDEINIIGSANSGTAAQGATAGYYDNIYTYTNTTGTVVPLSFTKLAAQTKAAGIELNWQTMNEINVRDFYLERSSDGVNFKKINTLSSANSSAVNDYTLLDNQPINGFNYYRIRSNDANGQYSYSTTAKALWKADASILFYPTVTKDGKLQMELHDQPSGDYQVMLSNIAGKNMYRKSVAHTGANGNYSLQLQQEPKKLLPGVYVISVYFGNSLMHTQKMIIE